MSFFNNEEDDQEFRELFPELECTSFLSTGRTIDEAEFHGLPGVKFVSRRDYIKAEKQPVEI